MGLFINILITLIGLTVIVIAFYNYIPYIEKLLREKLKISLFRNSKDHGVLGQIFYQYNHSDAQAWVDWAKSQEPAIKQEAIDQLIAHIDNAPSNWGSVTPEAIKALAQFEERAHMTIMKSVIKACKKFWKKYKISEACFEAALVGAVYINVESAKTLLEEEIADVEEEVQAMSIANTLKEFPEEEDIKPLIVRLLTNSRLSFKARNYTITTAQKINAEEAHLAFVETVDVMLDSQKGLNDSDIKIFEALLSMATQNVDEEAFNVLLKACLHEDLSKTSIRALELILRSNFDEFNPEQLYTLINIKTDVNGTITNTICDVNKLLPDEKMMCRYKDFDEQFPFKKAPVETETKTSALDLPLCLAKVYDELMDTIKKRSVEKQTGASGGILLTGYTDNEKLCLARVAASERKWHFIYTAVEDAVASGSTAKAMLDAMTGHKPCILYLDNIEILLKHLDNPFIKQLKIVANDPLVNIIGTLKDDVDIAENGLCVLFTQNLDMQEIFPIAMDIGQINEADRSTILHEKLAKLNSDREVKSIEQLGILDSTDGMTPFEFEKYLTKYFRSSILVSNKLIDKATFDKLDSISFEGRGAL